MRAKNQLFILISVGLLSVVLLMMPIAAATPYLLPTPTSRIPIATAAPPDIYPEGEAGTAIIHEAGWTRPIKLPFNDDGWEDSPYITRDGSQIIFFYHPYPDLITAAETLTEEILADPQSAVERGIDGKLYISPRPFTERYIHPISQDDSPALECCAYISQSGDLFYNSTRRSFELGESAPVTVYLNGERLDFHTGDYEGNPHYCDALDELWFDCPGDENLCIMRDAAAQDFQGEITLAPYPINAEPYEEIQDSQAFLTDDCMTLYITSDRAERGNIDIYRLERLDEEGQQWSEPQLFISNETPIAELSMTADGRELIFAQIFWRDDGSPGIDIYYSRKVEEE
ncbi:MAG: hypothetical protein D6712_08925 [Chloroflexi bacterium]|nr:MAG: hypothetical protein D6712_08925 [Chloroflexota bacterium]